MKYFFYISIFALLLLLIGCGVNSQTLNNTNSSNSANVGNSNSANNTAQPKQSVPNELPVGKPIENGTPQTFKNVSFIVPKDWKKVKTDEPNFAVKFASSEAGDAITLTIGISESVAEDKGPPQAKTIEDYLKQLNPEQKPRILEINGTKGVLLSFGELTSWLTFPPRDNTGKTVISDVSIICPISKIEQNKQLIADILYSVKFKK